MKKIVAILVSFLLLSCNQTPSANTNTTTLDFGAFTIETPASWKKVNAKGTDSYVGEIAIDEKDTLSFDLGWYSNKLHEEDVTFFNIAERDAFDSSYKSDPYVVFVKNRFLADPDKYKKTDFSWDTVGGYEAKIVFPRKSGIGTTGIYIDSLWTSGSGIDRFNLYGENLNPENEKLFLSALKTLKFYRK